MALLTFLGLVFVLGAPPVNSGAVDCSGQAAHTVNVAPFVPPSSGQAPTRPTVTVRVELSPDGDVVGASVASSSGAPEFDRAALTSARSSSYAPEKVNCRAVSGSYLMVFTVRGAVPVVVPVLHFVNGPLGDARLGIAAAVIGDFIDNGSALENPDARRFIDAFISTIGEPVADAYAKQQLGVMREVTMPAKSFDGGRARQQFERAFSVVMASDKTRTERLRFGQVVQAIALNASGRHSAFEDYSLRHELRDLAAMDAAKAGITEQRRRLAAEKAGDWAAIAARSAELLQLLLVD